MEANTEAIYNEIVRLLIDFKKRQETENFGEIVEHFAESIKEIIKREPTNKELYYVMGSLDRFVSYIMEEEIKNKFQFIGMKN